MITFLPCFSADFEVHSTLALCAQVLDDKRLGKQRIESRQIIQILSGNASSNASGTNNTSGTRGRHPAVLMWSGYLELLKLYYNGIVVEWVRRGRINTLPLEEVTSSGTFSLPWWWRIEAIYYSHAAMLRRKEPAYYSELTYPKEYADYGYVWPILSNKERLLNRELLAVIAAPIPKYLLDNRRCNAILKTGKRKGEHCGIVLRGKGEHCGIVLRGKGEHCGIHCI